MDEHKGLSQRISDDVKAAKAATDDLTQGLLSFSWGAKDGFVHAEQVGTMIATLDDSIAHLEALRDTLRTLRPA